MRKRQWRSVLILGGLLILTCLAGNSASAHAHLQSADPPDKAVLTKAPAQIVLTFTQPTSLTKSGGSVTDASGTLVSIGSKVDPSDGMKMVIDLKPSLSSGNYTVKWNTYTDAVNGPDDGTFGFSVQLPPEAAAPVSASTGATSVPNPGNGGDAMSRWLLVIAIICGTVTVFATGIALGTRTQQPEQ